MTSLRRIQKELGEIMLNSPEGATVTPNEENMMHWDVILTGPASTPYAGGRFVVTVEFTQDYPFKPPTMKFVTKAYHPNIDGDGNICIGMLKTENWKPATKMVVVLTALVDLLKSPNPDDPLVTSIAEQYMRDRKAFDEKAKATTAKHAK